MGIDTWEIWNEPNSGQFWKPGPQPDQYAELVRLTSAAIRSVQPTATIVLGSLAAGASASYRTPARQFLAQLCRLGVNRYVDVVGFHPYSFPLLANSSNRHNPWNFISNDSLNFESILASAGTPHMPIWITEYGAPTKGPGPPATGPNHAPHVFRAYVTEAFQVRLARWAVTVAERNLNVAALFWYTDKDTATPASPFGDYFGLRRHDGSPKPALAALRAAINSWKR
jgi:hypothetical protein